ncbi:MAG: DUF1080 domain-containing protein [Balneolaceae bacterium]|nr:DUF1080 domain-containing protein [Balneolaceae bacterium]
MKLVIFVLLLAFFPLCLTAQSTQPRAQIVGSWNITTSQDHGSAPSWLEIKRSGRSALVGSFVGSSGSARPVSKIVYNESDNNFHFTIPPQWEGVEDDLEFRFTLEDDQILGSTLIGDNRIEWTGRRAPELKRDQAPRWGNPVNLLDDNMSKWVIPENNQFYMEDGILVNEQRGGNLISKETFEDLKIRTEFRYPEGSNSGIYLRGRYEVQITDDYGLAPDENRIAGIYGFIAPSENSAKPANEWQTMDITLVGRMVTVVLNGKEVISNRRIPGITGGALDSNEGEPGPIMIQGDHGPIEFRKFVVTPARN